MDIYGVCSCRTHILSIGVCFHMDSLRRDASVSPAGYVYKSDAWDHIIHIHVLSSIYVFIIGVQYSVEWFRLFVRTLRNDVCATSLVSR